MPPSFPRLPGSIPVVLSAAFFRPLHRDCSIKEQDRQCAVGPETKGFVLHHRCTGAGGEQVGPNLVHRLFTGRWRVLGTRDAGSGGSAGLMQLEAEQRGEMASTLQRRKTEAYPEGMATGESH